jgi:hypothetical protein
MKHFFFSNYLAEKNFENEAITVANCLSQIFPNSLYLNNLLGNCYYLIHGKILILFLISYLTF